MARGPLAKLLEPAIRYCEEGFAVRPHVAYFWGRPSEHGRIARIRGLNEYPATAKIYIKPDGRARGVGEILKNPDMGRTLRRIAEHGVADFYTGAIAREIDADMKKHGGLITLADLAEARTINSEPLWTTYRGRRVATNPLPGGGLLIVLMLNILENFDLAAMGHNSPDYVAVVAEAMKIATVDKDTRIGDPRFVDVPLAELTSKAYAAKMAERIKQGREDPRAAPQQRRRQQGDDAHLRGRYEGQLRDDDPLAWVRRTASSPMDSASCTIIA